MKKKRINDAAKVVNRFWRRKNYPRVSACFWSKDSEYYGLSMMLKGRKYEWRIHRDMLADESVDYIMSQLSTDLHRTVSAASKLETLH